MFQNTICSIKPLDIEAMEKCQLRLDNLTKPLGSLHSFEKIARQMAGITGNHRPKILKKSMIIMKGITGDDPSESIAIRVFAQHVSAELILLDMEKEKITYGIQNSIEGPPMTKEQVQQAIEVGIKIAQKQVEKGCCIIGLGVLGTGVTISSIGIISCFSTKSIVDLVGMNTTLCQEVAKNRWDILETALSKKQPNGKDPLDVLRKIGNLELAGLVGVILGAAAGGSAVVLDGLGTSAAALLAVHIAPQVKDYLLASHFAMEPAHREVLQLISLPGYLHLGIQSEEGIGATLGMSLINASLHVINDMKTFGEAKVAVAQDGPGALKQCSDVKD